VHVCNDAGISVLTVGLQSESGNMAGRLPVHRSKEWFHAQLEPVHSIRPFQAGPRQQLSSPELMHAQNDRKEDLGERKYIQGSQVVKLDHDGKLIPLVRSVTDDLEDEPSDNEAYLFAGYQTPGSDGSVSPLLLAAGWSLTPGPVGSELSSSDAVTIREFSTAYASEPIDLILHERSKPPSKPPTCPLPALPRMPSLALMEMEPSKREDYVNWTPGKAEKALLPTPLRIPDKAVTKGSRRVASAPTEEYVNKGKKKDETNGQYHNVFDENGPAMLYGSGHASVGAEGGAQWGKRSVSAGDSMGTDSLVLYQQRLLSQSPSPFPLSWSDRKWHNAHLSLSAETDSTTSHKYHASVSSSASSTDKPLPPLPPASLGPALEMLRKRNSGSKGKMPMYRASQDQEQFRSIQRNLRSPRRSISPIQEGNDLDDLASSPPPPTEADEEEGDESHVHPLFRKNSIISESYAEGENSKPTPAQLPSFGHRPTVSDGSNPDIVAPADMKSPFTRSSKPPSSYLYSPPLSPTPPEHENEADTLAELPVIRSARSSGQRSSAEARTSLEMSGPEASYIRRNFMAERRRSREEMKEYAEAIEDIYGLARLRDIDEDLEAPLVLGRHELFKLGDIPNPTFSKVSLSPIAERTWPMKKKSSLLKRISTFEFQPVTRGPRESSSTISSGSLVQHSPGGCGHLSGSSGDTTDRDTLPTYTPATSVAPDTPSRKRLMDVFRSKSLKKEHAVTVQDSSKEGHELVVMEPLKEEHEATAKGLEENGPKGTRGQPILRG